MKTKKKEPKFEELFFSRTKDFLDVYLVHQAARSEHTVRAYRTSLTSFYVYVTEEKKISPLKYCFSDCTYEFVLGYSQYLQEKKGLVATTVNQRLAALRTYLKYAADNDIALMQVYLSVTKVPLLRTKKLQRPVLEKDALKMLLDLPPATLKGNRDRALLVVLFVTAVRGSELVNITIGDVSLYVSEPCILINGKGKKQRVIVLDEKTADHLRIYIRHYHEEGEPLSTPLFYTRIHGQIGTMTERNVERIVKKYADLLRKEHPEIPESVYPHMMRRSRATGMYRDGVPLEMVAAILGHASTETTKIYAIPSVEQMRKALSKGQPEDDGTQAKDWKGRDDEMRRIFGLNGPGRS